MIKIADCCNLQESPASECHKVTPKFKIFERQVGFLSEQHSIVGVVHWVRFFFQRAAQCFLLPISTAVFIPIVSHYLVVLTVQVINVSASHNVDVFQAARVGVGLLGVITMVTLQAEDQFNLHEVQTPLMTRDCVSYVQQAARSAEYVKLWIYGEGGLCQLHRSNRTDRPQYRNPSRLRRKIEVNLKVFAVASLPGFNLCGLLQWRAEVSVPLLPAVSFPLVLSFHSHCG